MKIIQQLKDWLGITDEPMTAEEQARRESEDA